MRAHSYSAHSYSARIVTLRIVTPRIVEIHRRLYPAGWAAGTPEPMLKIPAAVPLDLHIFEFLVLLCAFWFFLIRGFRPRPACLRRSFFTHCPEFLARELPEFF